MHKIILQENASYQSKLSDIRWFIKTAIFCSIFLISGCKNNDISHHLDEISSSIENIHSNSQDWKVLMKSIKLQIRDIHINWQSVQTSYEDFNDASEFLSHTITSFPDSTQNFRQVWKEFQRELDRWNE